MSAGARDQGLRRLEERLGHRFREPGLLERALTHSSAAHEDLAGELRHNEPLELLGDAVIALATVDVLHRRDPEGPEGRKTKLKALLVSEQTLAARAEGLGLPELLRLGKGEEKTGGRKKRALAADAYEAVVAALYLDGGFQVAARFVAAALEAELAEERRLPVRDPKTKLQERLQAQGLPLPEYLLAAKEGPAHRRLFRMQCVVCGEVMGEGVGSSKKTAQQGAARAALDALRARETGEAPPAASAGSV
jgi:ribonuclease-3